MKTKSKTESNSVIIIGVTILMAVVLFGALATYIGTVARDPQLYNMIQSEENFVAVETQTLQVDEGITSHSLKVYNNTWLEFDGVDDYVLVEESENTSITFWYMNSTSSDWIFVANVSGTTYVGGVLGTPVEYPIYFNDTHYFIGKYNATSFYNGSIDDFRVYDFLLSSTEVNSIMGNKR